MATDMIAVTGATKSSQAPSTVYLRVCDRVADKKDLAKQWAEALTAGGGFVPTPTGSELRNPHLSYAVQWFSFAALLVLFVALLSFPRRTEKDPAP